MSKQSALEKRMQMTVDYEDMRQKVVSLTAERDALLADANRYRWIRNNTIATKRIITTLWTGFERLEDAIDDEIAEYNAARAAMEPKP